MKILILSFYYAPDLSAGSFRCTALVDELKALVGTDFELEVITTVPNRYASYTALAPAIEQSSGLTIRRIVLPPHKGSLLSQANAFIYFAKETRKLVKENQYDLVFATSSRLMTAVLGAWVAHKKKASLYLDIRDIFIDTIQSVLPATIVFCIKPFFSLLEKWSFTKAQRINLVSEGFKSYFNSRYPLADFRFYTNGIDPEFILTMKDEPPRPPSKLLTIVYAGNMGDGQELHTIVPALAKRLEGKAQFKLIGDGGRRKELELAIKIVNCNNIALIAPMGRLSLIKEYLAADVLFLHLNDSVSFERVLPSKLFEYAAMGKPILAGVSGYAAEFINNNVSNAAIFQPGSASDAALMLPTLQLKTEQRTNFIGKYKRHEIARAMAIDVLALLR